MYALKDIRIIALLACFILTVHPDLTAQSRYKRLSTNDGLAQNFVSSIVQDRRGFLWFGTFDGLSRYDGYSFRNYRIDPLDTMSLSSGFISALHVASSGMLWIGFMDGSVNLFDPRTERFRRISVQPSSVAAEFSRRITSIAEYPSGTIWIGTAGAGLIRCTVQPSKDNATAETIEVTSFTAVGTSPSMYSVTKIRSLYADIKGMLWVQTDRSILIVEENGQSARQVWRSSTTGDTVTVICRSAQDSSGGYWFVTTNNIVYVQAATGEVRQTEIRTLWKDPVAKNGGYLSVSYDERTDEIWATTQYDIIRVDRRDGRYARRPVPISTNGLSVLYTMSTIDRSGTIWFGTMGFGAYRYDRKVDAFGLIPDLNLTELMRQLSGLPVPADDALNRFPENVRGYYGAYSHTDSSGQLWTMVQTEQSTLSIQRYDPSTGSRVEFRTGMGPRQINGPYYPVFLELRDGGMWIVNYFYGVDRIDRRTNTVVHYQIIGDKLTPVQQRLPFSVATVTGLADPDGSAWIGTMNRGLIHLDPSTLAVKRFSFSAEDSTSIGHDYVTTVCTDPSDPARYLWVGTYGGGLSRLDRTTGSFLRFNERTGLPNNVINAIKPDRKGFLWISSNHGLWRLDPRTLKFRYYDINDGLQGLEFNRFEAYAAPDGQMFFGGTEGVNAFYPEQITENTHVPPVVFTDLKIKNRSVQLSDRNSPLKESISETQSIVLHYEDNIITFGFAALDFINAGKNRYSYRLSGFSDEWSIPSTDRTATFTNLDPGEYTFSVRGSNGDGVWNMDGASISVVILPPWYRTWWAYASYLISFMLAMLFVRRYELKRIRLKDELLLEQTRSEQLKGIDQMKMRFFQNISHEFRTPLTLILGPIEKLIERSSDETNKRDFRMIRRNANRLLRLINQLLDISRLESGGMKLNAVQGNIVDFVRGITMSFHSLAERKEIFLDVRTDPQRIPAYFDKDKLEKMLVNLIGNAFKFTPENGEVHIVVSVRGDLQLQKGWVDISVRDTGIGISPEKLPRVFDRFYQVDTSSTRSHEGTGIGLSLVKELIEIHKGQISVESTPGKGTVFTISLPLGKSHLLPTEIMDTDVHRADGERYVQSEVEQSEFLPTDSLPPDDAPDENIPLLLIIEDNYDVREFIKSYIAPQYRVIEAYDGEEGIRKAKESVPDLIISDVMMPKKDGYEVCHAVKKEEATSHIPVILLTAKAASEDKISGLEIGADDYLVKPFDSTELLVRVKNLIENRRLLREKFGMETVALKPEEITVTPVEQIFLGKVKAVIEQRMGDENFDVEELAAALNMSYTQLHRKLKAVINQPANQFIRSMRLHRAMEILKQNGAIVSETAYTVGFSSPAYFTKCFTEQFGVSPAEVRKRTT